MSKATDILLGTPKFVVIISITHQTQNFSHQLSSKKWVGGFVFNMNLSVYQDESSHCHSEQAVASTCSKLVADTSLDSASAESCEMSLPHLKTRRYQ